MQLCKIAQLSPIDSNTMTQLIDSKTLCTEEPIFLYSFPNRIFNHWVNSQLTNESWAPFEHSDEMLIAVSPHRSVWDYIPCPETNRFGQNLFPSPIVRNNKKIQLTFEMLDKLHKPFIFAAVKQRCLKFIIYNSSA